jgi:protein-disulfide isomerase
MKKETVLLGIIAILVIIAAVIGANYYRSSIQSERKPITTANASLIREDSPTIGNADAKVTIVEFYDPECESCRTFHPTIKKVLKDYDGKTRLVARIMPLHPNSILAATFLEVAGENGKYWTAQEFLFQKQPEWGTKHGPPSNDPPPDVKVLFEKYAMELGLDLEKLNSAVKENKFAAKFERDKKDGQANGVRQTPTIFVNGRQLARLYETDLKALIEDELKK